MCSVWFPASRNVAARLKVVAETLVDVTTSLRFWITQPREVSKERGLRLTTSTRSDFHDPHDTAPLFGCTRTVSDGVNLAAYGKSNQTETLAEALDVTDLAMSSP